MRARLDQIEARTIHILREARATARNLGMLWSIGKDSTVLLWLARKAFFGRVPFPLIHIDTGYKIPEMIQYRDRLAREWGLDLLYGQNEEALAARRTFPDGALDRIGCCRVLKTEALRRTIDGDGTRYRMSAEGKWVPSGDRTPFTAIIVGLRADEEGSRSKERYFSPRSAGGTWRIDAQPPELWNLFNVEAPPGAHLRIHPLLDWTELDVWEYIAREKIPTVSLYYDHGDGKRYRSLGCAPCTRPIASRARNPEEIVQELRSGQLRDVPERSGRAQDEEDGGGLETLRREGYM